MAYDDTAGLAGSYPFQQRAAACYATETLAAGGEVPPAWAADHAWQLAAQPGFGDAYAAGGQESITDQQILGAVQSLLAP